MNRVYPFVTPQILTDDIFVSYGGATGTSTATQRTLAYTMAEEWISDHINTPIAQATITGSYFYPQHGRTIQLEWAWLDRIDVVRFYDTEEDVYYTITGTNNTYAAIRNKDRSIIDILTLYGNCQGCGRLYAPYNFEIVYKAGLPANINTSPKVYWALTEAAQLVLNEVQGFGNEASLVGVREFRNQEYSEKRNWLHNTIFGSSPKAMLIEKILSGVRRRMKVGL